MGKQGGLELLNKVKTPMGNSQSWKRKRVIKDSDHSRSKQRRISNKTKSIKGVTCIQKNQVTVYASIQRHFQLEISLRMAYKLHESSSECSVSALDLFYVPPTQTSVQKGTWVDVRLIVSVSDTKPIELESEGKQKEFLDLAHTLLYVTVQLVKSDGSDIDCGSKVAPVKLFLHSLFVQPGIDMNGRTISDGSSTSPYRAYLETLLSYREEAKSTHLTSSVFYKDTVKPMLMQICD